MTADTSPDLTKHCQQNAGYFNALSHLSLLLLLLVPQVPLSFCRLDRFLPDQGSIDRTWNSALLLKCFWCMFYVFVFVFVMHNSSTSSTTPSGHLITINMIVINATTSSTWSPKPPEPFLLLHSGHLNMIVVIVIMIIRVAQLAASLHPGWEKMEREWENEKEI